MAKTTDPTRQRTCERCGKKHLGEFVFLELNKYTLHYATPGTVPEGESQGLFAFGKTCAYHALGHERLDADRVKHPERYTADGKSRYAIRRQPLSLTSRLQSLADNGCDTCEEKRGER